MQTRYNIPEVLALETNISDALATAFGDGTPAFNRYKDAGKLDNGPHLARMEALFGGRVPVNYEAREAQEARRYLAQGKERSIILLRQAINTLEGQIVDQEPGAPGPEAAATRAMVAENPSKVFVVHGHDEGAREAVARFIGALGFEPIILHEQANAGRTVIEKVEAHGEVHFAVVLLTPDDLGKAKDSAELKPRARQNVLLELGYFIGRLGRSHVCALKRGELEIPSDFGGVVYETFDASSGWKQALGRELEAAGFEIDWNKVMRS